LRLDWKYDEREIGQFVSGKEKLKQRTHGKRHQSPSNGEEDEYRTKSVENQRNV